MMGLAHNNIFLIFMLSDSNCKMASLVDRGDSRSVTYLGCCMLATGTTGLGVLQKPLRELYFKYRQAGATPDPSRQRFLTISSRGMTMRWQQKPGMQPTEVCVFIAF